MRNGGRRGVQGASLLVAIALLVAPRLVVAQTAPVLTVAIEGGRTEDLTLAILRSMPRATVTTTDGGRQLRYEGVLLGELLARVGAPIGSSMGRGAVASYVIAEASDGYQVVLSLGEIDPSLGASQVLVADTVDGMALPATQGPFRLVVGGDKGGARSARMLQRLSLRFVPARAAR